MTLTPTNALETCQRATLRAVGAKDLDLDQTSSRKGASRRQVGFSSVISIRCQFGFSLIAATACGHRCWLAGWLGDSVFCLTRPLN